MGFYSVTLEGVAATVWDAARASHTQAASMGEFFQEMMDQAVQSGHTTESGLDVIRRISGEASGGATSDSLMHRIENPAAAGKQTQLSEDSARFSIVADGSLDVQPASGEFDTTSFQVDDGSTIGNITPMLKDGSGNLSHVITLSANFSFLWVLTNAMFVKFLNTTGAGAREGMRATKTEVEEA